MIDHTVALYCITDDLLKAVGHREDSRRAMTDAEVLTAALLAAHYFGGNVEHARRFLRETGLVPRMLSRSRLNRRLHAVAELAYSLFHQLGSVLKQINVSTKYLLDSFPVPVCDNIRIKRCRLARGEQFRGRSAAKRRYFYGVKVQVVTTEEGSPVEMAFPPGAASDVRGLEVLPLALPAGSELFMDSGYTDYAAEDAARELDGVTFAVQRKRRSRRWDDPWRARYKQLMRKRIETVFSQITAMFPRHIHATRSLAKAAPKIERAFWDTSAIVPLCCQQDASQEVRRIARRVKRVAAWWGTTVEARSAFSRLVRDGNMTARGLQQAAARLDVYHASWVEVLPGERVREIAETLPEQYGLRALDSFQLAAALVWCKEQPPAWRPSSGCAPPKRTASPPASASRP